MTYDDLALKVSDRYSELVAENGTCDISILKEEFGLNTSVILEILGIKDILDFDVNVTE